MRRYHKAARKFWDNDDDNNGKKNTAEGTRSKLLLLAHLLVKRNTKLMSLRVVMKGMSS